MSCDFSPLTLKITFSAIRKLGSVLRSGKVEKESPQIASHLEARAVYILKLWHNFQIFLHHTVLPWSLNFNLLALYNFLGAICI